MTDAAFNPDSLVSPVTSEIRLVILDIDGTISGESNEVNPAVVEALQAAKHQGIQIAIATGRMYCSALYFAQAIGADLPIICYNGAWIRDTQTDKTLWHLPVPRELALELL
ncbi:MAG: HAD family hydrolase, partial [Halothece sp. Uz-M2-17]|nr:HAD family hydrolase [Halothece sp. Uz-M2-17]